MAMDGCMDNQMLGAWRFIPAQKFNDHVESWRQINRNSANSPALEPELVLAALQHLGDGKELIALMERGADIVAMGILRRKNPWVWETFQPSQIPLGAWLVRSDASCSEVAYSLLRALPGMPLLLGVTQLDPDLSVRPDSDEKIRTVDYINTARITIQGTFEEYWAARGKNLRQNMKRQRNSLERSGVVTRLDVLTSPEDVPTAIAAYARMETAGWKATGGTAIAPDNVQGKFYTQLLQSFAAQGRAHIYRYWYDDRIVAMDLCISHDGIIIILKTTYDEREQASSPAMLMRQDAFKAMFESQRFKRVEFYGKVMEWHTRWTNEIRTMYHLNIYRWSPMAKVLGK
jgi:CelD/BcsL family acetyltransferase involved in cellulose biosynthesis